MQRKSNKWFSFVTCFILMILAGVFDCFWVPSPFWPQVSNRWKKNKHGTSLLVQQLSFKPLKRHRRNAGFIFDKKLTDSCRCQRPANQFMFSLIPKWISKKIRLTGCVSGNFGTANPPKNPRNHLQQWVASMGRQWKLVVSWPVSGGKTPKVSVKKSGIHALMGEETSGLVNMEIHWYLLMLFSMTRTQCIWRAIDKQLFMIGDLKSHVDFSHFSCL